MRNLIRLKTLTHRSGMKIYGRLVPYKTNLEIIFLKTNPLLDMLPRVYR